MKTTRRPLPRISKKRKGEQVIYAKRKKVFLSKHHHCQRCDTYCSPQNRDLHHWAKRAGKLYLEERLWVMLCRGCHDWVHRNEQQAQKDGWLAPRGAVNDHARALKAWERLEWRTYIAELDGVE